MADGILASSKPAEDGKKSAAETTTVSQAAPAIMKRENPYQKQLKEIIFSGDPDERRALADIRPHAPDQFSIQHPPILANVDSDIIKLTAQFVARNGQKFLQGLTEREQRNP